MTEDARKPLAVIGVGNVLFGDDGFGVRVIWELQKNPPSGADLIDGGSLGLDLLDLLQSYWRVIIVDAADMALPPGTVKTFAPDDVRSIAPDDRLSLHSTDILGVIELGKALGETLADVTIVAVQPDFVGPKDGLSDVVARALPAAVEAVTLSAGRLQGR